MLHGGWQGGQKWQKSGPNRNGRNKSGKLKILIFFVRTKSNLTISTKKIEFLNVLGGKTAKSNMGLMVLLLFGLSLLNGYS